MPITHVLWTLILLALLAMLFLFLATPFKLLLDHYREQFSHPRLEQTFSSSVSGLPFSGLWGGRFFQALAREVTQVLR